jgi:hypothetical protein
MRGRVKIVNPERGICAAEVEDSGGYIVLELIGSEVEPGDVLVGDLESTYLDKIWNETQREFADVLVRCIYCDLWTARKRCFS